MFLEIITRDFPNMNQDLSFDLLCLFLPIAKEKNYLNCSFVYNLKVFYESRFFFSFAKEEIHPNES